MPKLVEIDYLTLNYGETSMDHAVHLTGQNLVEKGEVISLSQTSKNSFIQAITSVSKKPYSNNLLPDYIKAAEAVHKLNLPELKFVHQKLLQEHSPAILLSNLPNDIDIPPTDNNCRFRKQTSFSEATSIALLYPYGKLITYSDKRDGQVVSDLYPKQSDSEKQLGTGTVFLEWHTDEAFHVAPPSFVCLFGVRGEPQAKTLVAEFDLSKLPNDTYNILTKPLYRIEADGSHSKQGQINHTSIIKFENEKCVIRFDPVYTKFDSDIAEQAFRDLESFVLKKSLLFAINSNEALIFNNRVGIHARTEYSARFDGTDRWLNKSQVVPYDCRADLFEESSSFLLKPIGNE